MPRDTRRSRRTACTFWIPLVTLGALALSLLLARDAAAQATAPATQPAAAVEAGDTAPPPGAPPVAPPPAPIAPLAPPSAGPGAIDVAPGVAADTAPLVVPAPPAPRHTPIYQKHWFWGAVGVLAVTGMILLAVALSSAAPDAPSTRLGDMRAF